MTGRTPTLILITDPRFSTAHVEGVIEAVARAGLGTHLAVQLRDKAATAAQLESTARVLRAATARVGALLVVNAPIAEFVRVASVVGADGVHVPVSARALVEARSTLGEAAWISTPAHCDADVTVAAACGATSILVSPIWSSPGKGGAPRGIAALESARVAVAAAAPAATGVHVYALGGVDPTRVVACARAGAAGVAVIRALLEVTDPGAVARALDAPFHTAVGARAAEA